MKQAGSPYKECMMSTSVQENYRSIESRLVAACERAGRKREEVTLIAVSKTKPEEKIRELMEIGVRDFGENKVQDLCKKMEDIAGNNRWHFIGTLQRNKVKYLVGSPVCLIHSVDSARLAEAIEKEAAKKQVTIPVLLEINIGGEESKGGVAPAEAEALLRQAAALPHLRVKGLMTVAPPGSGEENRPYFRRMRELRDSLSALALPGVEMTELSMGMTDDFEAAILEGATMVRVGTAIFGARQYDEPEWKP